MTHPKKMLLPLLCMCTLMCVLCSFRRQPPLPDRHAGAYKLSVQSLDEFKSIQGAPLSDKFSDVLSVKIVFDLSSGTLYFTNSANYRYHFEFCAEVLDNHEPLELFNELNYGNSIQRQYLLANINYYAQSHLYALEFASEDQVSADKIVDLFHLVQAKTYIKDSLHLLIGSDKFIKLAAEGKLPVSQILPADIYKEQKFQLLNLGVAYGVLRRAEDLKDGAQGAIVIMKGTPVNVPVCAGIITNSFQTPLSHINILCHNRNIPSAVQTNIMTYPGVKENLGKPVRLVVGSNGITITPAEMKDVDSFVRLHTARTTVALKYDNSVKQLLPIKDFNLKQTNIIGNKAAGVGELYRIAHIPGVSFSVPEGAFAIPFYFYQQHIAQAPIRWKIDDLAKLQQRNAPEAAIKDQLKLIRKAIKEQPIDTNLMAQVPQQRQCRRCGWL